MRSPPVAGHFLDTHMGILCVQWRLAWQHCDRMCLATALTCEAGWAGRGYRESLAGSLASWHPGDLTIRMEGHSCFLNFTSL